ncbi:MAG: UDP-N-acetylmuramoyl-L-alanyl-D-glutamate--2,6-diaminopimelate ligase, partial [Bacilli bacterium]
AARNYEIIINRKTAIREAISRAKAGDIVIITGKGNDKYFEENNKVYAYSDIAEVRKALGERKKRG